MTPHLLHALLLATADANTVSSLAAAAAGSDDGGWDGRCRLSKIAQLESPFKIRQRCREGIAAFQDRRAARRRVPMPPPDDVTASLVGEEEEIVHASIAPAPASDANSNAGGAEEEGGERCSICLDDLDEGCMKLCDRGHRLHTDCAIGYLNSMGKDVCPVCNIPDTNFLHHCSKQLTIDPTKDDKAAGVFIRHQALELQRANNMAPTADDNYRRREMEYNHATREEIERIRQDSTIAQLQRQMMRRQEVIAAEGATMPPRTDWRTLPGRMAKPYHNDAYFQELKRHLDELGPQDVVLMAITAIVPLDLAPLEVIQEEYAKLVRKWHLDALYNGGAPEGPGFEYKLVAREGNVVLPYVTVERPANRAAAPARLTNTDGHTGLAWGMDQLDDQDPVFTVCVLKKTAAGDVKVAFNSYDYEHPGRYPFPGGLPEQPFPVFANWATGRDVTAEYDAHIATRDRFTLTNNEDAQWWINIKVAKQVAERLAREKATAAAAAQRAVVTPVSMAARA